MYLVRARGRGARLVTVLETGPGPARVRSVDATGEQITVETVEGTDRHLATPGGWEVTGRGGTTRLGGLRRTATTSAPLIDLNRPTHAEGAALYVQHPPDLDGTLDGFDASAPMALD